MIRDNKPAVLLLEDGTAFFGRSCGTIGTASGEIAFSTAMTGYQELFTDPSCFGQIMVMNTVHIGTYGVHPDEWESDSCKISGLVVKEFSDTASRPSATKTLQQYLVENNIVGITEVDTRALVRHIREQGAMNCIISSENLDIDSLTAKLKSVPKMDGLELSSKVTCKEAYTYGDENAAYRISVLDLGIKRNILRCLQQRNAFMKVFPLDSSLEDILSFAPDGIMLSNGPGDPSVLPKTQKLIQELINTGIPIFGICLGHQLIGLSQGLTTEKMRNGHRGANHPVKNLLTGKNEITSQNHGFVLSHDSAKGNKTVEITHIHLNDNTIAGIRLIGKPVFSVQYHPEGSAGPHDSFYLFDEFMESIKIHKNQKTPVA